MERKKRGSNPQRLRFIVDFEVSLDEAPPAMIFVSPDEVIRPQAEARHCDLTAHITINGRQYSFAHFLSSPLIGESELNNWRQAVTDFIAKHTPEQLVGLFKNLMSEASNHASGAPKAMIANPSETNVRLYRREKRARQKRINLKEKGRPKKGRERFATRQRQAPERVKEENKLRAEIKALKDDYRKENKGKGELGIKSYVAERLYGESSNPLQELRRKLKNYNMEFSDI